MNVARLKTIIITAACLLSLISCDFLSQTGSQQAQVMIDLGGSVEDSAARGVGIVPTDVISFTVSISGSGMETIQKTVSPGTKYLNMYVPAGADRNIRVDANVDPVMAAANDREHLLSYAGEATVDLRPGMYRGIRIAMEAGRTKLIVPSWYNSLFYRITSMTSPLGEFNTMGLRIRDYDLDST
ncbi:MAG: hypothetical protein EHM28_01100 [Spirochaetaceae bacterium]|nr:MAG: hypothetical protein EHM28_01100 [Spirochaetaceae bacterium]